MSAVEQVYRLLARLYPGSVDPDDELGVALSFLGWNLTPSIVVKAGYGAGIVVGSVSLCLSGLFLHQFLLAGVLATFALGFGVAFGVTATPNLWATARRTGALGAAPDLVARTVLRMRLSPAPERAAQFTATSGESALANNLARHVRKARHTGTSGLSTFGAEWDNMFPSLQRSVALIHAAGSADESDRERLLDRALGVVLDGTREQMNSFASKIRAPVTALYAFGVLLPIACIALLPAAGAAGLSVTIHAILVVYGLVLPALCLIASVWILSRRPVAFPPPNVTTDHPDVDDRRPLAVTIGVLAGMIAWILTSRVAPAWGPPVAAVGVSVGSALWLTYRPVVVVYERIRDAESELSDAVALVGRRVANGRAVETAIDQTASELDGPLGETFAAGAHQIQQVQVGVHEAFLGEYGVCRDVPSRRIRGSMALVALGATEGRPVGGALIALADHIDDLRQIQQDARYSLAHVCRTLSTTGALFAPMVGGATVALADGIGTGLIDGAESIPWLGAVVGWYILVLAVLLPALATGLTDGLDRSLVGHRVGRSLVGATTAFFATYLLVGAIV